MAQHPKNLVIVESPAKANTINKYLGDDYKVLASYGHIRDLAAKNGSVNPDDGFSMVWTVEPDDQKRINEIAKEVKRVERVILATDPDREGEAISWHVYDVLKSEQLLDGKDVRRVVFNEITKNAILKAMEQPRQIDQSLVDAYMARRALDYLVGFTLSPVLWRKLPGSKSAGRVQSVALRLICDREDEIEAFTPQEYWSVDAIFEGNAGKSFTAHLTEYKGEKQDRLSVGNADRAMQIVATIEANQFAVKTIERKQARRNPPPPFITSTMQQEAARKLGFTVTRTMQVAQKLYEGIDLGGETVGLITYMRTDGVTLSDEALGLIRQQIRQDYGDKYLPDAPRVYKSKSKNAQEAHEAIRPTNPARRPNDVKPYLSDDQFELYELIWKRAMASQMENVVLDQVGVDIAPTTNRDVVLRATGSVIVFDGFYKLYREGRDDLPEDKAADSEDSRELPAMTEGEALKRLGVDPEQHFTKPPPRFTEASLVKALEEYGIGRPSTYASIIRILRDRNYVVMDGKRFIPEDRGRLVTTFLKTFFERYVQYNFTAELEDRLDEISDSQLDWRTVLTDFWVPFKEAVDGTGDLTITRVLDELNEALGHHFFPPREDGGDPRACTTCKDGVLGLRLGKFGAFIGCSNYPECKYTRQLKSEGDAGGDELTANGPAELGEDPETQKKVYLCKGPYGFYVQLGEEEEVPPEPEAEKKAKKAATTKSGKPKKEPKPKKIKPKRSSLPRGLNPSEVTLDKALSLLSLPRELGVHPETGETISAAIGRFGPYVKMGPLFVSMKAEDDVLTIDLSRAVELIAASGKKVITLGEHKKKPVMIQKGRFGYYIKFGTLNVNLPKGTDPESITLEDAIARIDAKAEKEKGAKGAKADKADKTEKPAKKPATQKKTTTAKKTTGKKSTAKKKTAAKK